LCQAAPKEVVVVQSSDIRPFSDAIEGFEESCDCVIKDIITVSPGGLDVAAQIHRLKPDSVLALGLDSLTRLHPVRSIPIFYTMVTSPPQSMQVSANVSGVSMIVTPERLIESMLQLLPKAKRWGVIYDPANTGMFVERLIQNVRHHSIEVIARKTKNPREVPQILEELKGKVEVLLMLPDITVTTPETVNTMLIFSFRNMVPLISFSEKYVSMGAFAAVTVSTRDLGVQTGEMVRQYFSGGSGQRQGKIYARKNLMIINMKIARKLGIAIRDAVLIKSKRVE
jgi:putative ABC transport system substrate-binding protein